MQGLSEYRVLYFHIHSKMSITGLGQDEIERCVLLLGASIILISKFDKVQPVGAEMCA